VLEEWRVIRPGTQGANSRFRDAYSDAFGVDVDVFNLLNRATPSNVTWVSGPTFGYATEVLPARVVRVGGRFSF